MLRFVVFMFMLMLSVVTANIAWMTFEKLVKVSMDGTPIYIQARLGNLYVKSWFAREICLKWKKIRNRLM